MGSGVLLGLRLLLAQALVLFLCLQEPLGMYNIVVVHGSQVLHQKDSILSRKEQSNILPVLSPSSSPQPFIPFLAPSPLAPFTNVTTPKLSGQCKLNFSSVDRLVTMTAVDCWATFAPFLANVICCPQLEAAIVILVGQSSRTTGMLGLDSFHANNCLSDFQQILAGQGASVDLETICSIKPANLTAASCPVNDSTTFEGAVDSSQLLSACEKVDPVTECCSQKCQNAILEAARKIALGDGQLPSMNITETPPELSSTIGDCKNVVLRWLSSKMELMAAKDVLRRISNCNVNSVCPLVLPDAKAVAEDCQNNIRNHRACCSAVENYVSHLQKQSFITNLQALNCAASFGLQLQTMNVSTNIYTSCDITLKDFSLQVGSQESGCLLPSLPSDATFDPISGISFTCDLNDNIAAPWPSSSLSASSSTCNKTVRLPELPAATSAKEGRSPYSVQLVLLTSYLLVFTMLL